MKINTIYILFLLLALTYSASAGSAFSISGVDTSAYPYASVYFSAFEDNFVEFKDLTPADFVVKENGKIIPEKDVIVDCASDTAILNIVLVLDQSASMDSLVNGRRKWDWVKDGAKEFIDYVGGYDSVYVAIVAFAGESRIKCNFTNNPQELRDSLFKISSISSITNFNHAFLDPETGALELLKSRPVNQRRIVVFLSDGHHSSHSEDLEVNKITETHLANNIQLFSITFMSQNNPSLTYISNQTGGRNYDLKKPEELNDIYKEIAKLVINKTICKLMWLSDIICHSDERFREVEIELLRVYRSKVTTSYIAPFQSLAFLVSDKIIYYFGNPPPNESHTEIITLKGGVNTVNIYDYKIEPNQFF